MPPSIPTYALGKTIHHDLEGPRVRDGLIVHQSISREVPVRWYGQRRLFRATVRFDDRCGNGRETLGLTGEIINLRKRIAPVEACGMMHAEIVKIWPDLADAARLHLCSRGTGPMHYGADTRYHAEKGDYALARASACWDVPDAALADPAPGGALDRALAGHLPVLLSDLQRTVESLGMAYRA